MKDVIQKIIYSPIHFAKFLNTLSLLEYIGARKIIKSQHQKNINEKILAHAIEELRHAQVLKKAAKKIIPGLCHTYSTDELLCGTDAIQYFQTIDQAVQNKLKEKGTSQTYLYTTYLIETRAIEFYNLFEEALAELEKPSIFRGILIEENRHLIEVVNCLKKDSTFSNNISFLTSLEKNQFNHLIRIIEHSI